MLTKTCRVSTASKSLGCMGPSAEEVVKTSSLTKKAMVTAGEGFQSAL